MILRRLLPQSHNVPGWNDLVQEKHDLARQAFLEWVRSGRPHDNVLLPRMRRTRAAFKLTLRYYRTHEEQLYVQMHMLQTSILTIVKKFGGKCRKIAVIK